MLSRAIIKNFKSIGEPGVDLELKPLTLLVVPNGGGDLTFDTFDQSWYDRTHGST